MTEVITKRERFTERTQAPRWPEPIQEHTGAIYAVFFLTFSHSILQSCLIRQEKVGVCCHGFNLKNSSQAVLNSLFLLVTLF